MDSKSHNTFLILFESPMNNSKEQSKSKLRVKKNEERYRSLFENMNSGFVLFKVVHDNSGIPTDLLIQSANSEFANTTGLELNEVIGKPLTQVLPGIENDEANWIERYSNVALTGEKIHFEQRSDFLGKCYAVSAFQNGPGECAVTFLDISEQKKTEKLLRKSEERFRIAQEHSPDGFTILQPLRNKQNEIIDFVWLYQNKTIARINGTDQQAVVGKRLLDLFPSHKGSEIYQAYVDVANSGVSKTLDNVFVGEVVSVPTWLRLVIVSMGEDIAIMGQDITIRKRAELAKREEMNRAEKQRKLIAQLMLDDSLESNSIEDVLKHLTKKVADTLQVERAGIWQLSEDGKMFKNVAQYDSSDEYTHQDKVFNTTDFPAYFDLIRKESLIAIEDTLTEQRTKQFSKGYLLPLKISSMVGSVIQQSGRMAGFISIEHRGPVRKWRNDEKSFLSAISSHIAHLFSSEERKKAEDKLAESEFRFRKIFEDGASGMVIAGRDFKFKKVNKTFCDITGYTENELQKLTFSDITHPDDRIKDFAKADSMMKGEADFYKTEKRYIKKDGELIWVELTVSPIYDSNREFLYFVGIIIEVTERKLSEERLKLFNRAVDASSVSIIITDTEGRIEYVNPFFTKVTGYTVDDVLGKNPNILRSGSQTDEFYDDMWERLKSGKEWSGIFHNKKKNGELFWESATISPVVDTVTGEPTQFVAIKEDITELRNKENDLKESLREKEIMLAEIHHRVKNNLAVISALLELQSYDNSNAIVLEKLSVAISRIKSMANIHESLYKSKSFSNIFFTENIKNLVSNNFDLFGVGDNIKTELSLKPVQLNINQAVPCLLIVNEVVTNALKHAFIKEKPGVLRIEMSEQKNRVEIIITDNGIGLTSDYTQKENSSGIKIIGILTDQLKGSYTYERTNFGTEFLLAFNKEYLKGSSSTLF